MPASAISSASSAPTPGAFSLGLNTTVLPKHSAGAIFQAGMAIGKFHGVMMATTPSASRRVKSSVSVVLAGSTSPPMRKPSPA